MEIYPDAREVEILVGHNAEDLVDYPQLQNLKEENKFMTANRRLVDAQPFQPFLLALDPEDPEEKKKGPMDLKSIVPKIKKIMKPEMPKMFISYSHKDSNFKDQLVTHLSALKRLGQIKPWDDTQIRPGTEWEEEISQAMSEADIFLLLVSPDFIDSEYCHSIELEHAMKRHRAKSAVVVPVIVRPCYWEELPFGKLQGVPKLGKPISTWENKDEAYLEVVKGVVAVLDGKKK